jgi:prevent-host-death family protein
LYQTVVSVGVTRFKARLGEYLRMVEGGVTIVIERRGSPVARLTPGAFTASQPMVRKAIGSHKDWTPPPPLDLAGLDAVEVLMSLRGQC